MKMTYNTYVEDKNYTGSGDNLTYYNITVDNSWQQENLQKQIADLQHENLKLQSKIKSFEIAQDLLSNLQEKINSKEIMQVTNKNTKILIIKVNLEKYSVTYERSFVLQQINKILKTAFKNKLKDYHLVITAEDIEFKNLNSEQLLSLGLKRVFPLRCVKL